MDKLMNDQVKRVLAMLANALPQATLVAYEPYVILPENPCMLRVTLDVPLDVQKSQEADGQIFYEELDDQVIAQLLARLSK